MMIRKTLQYLPAQVVGPAFQFVAVLVWTHRLQPSDFGFIALVFAVQELAFTLCLSWWTQFTVRYLPGLADRSAYERSESAVILLSALAQLPVVIVALALTGHLGSPALIGATLAFTLSRTINVHLGERARALSDVATYTIVQLAGPVVGFAAGLALMSVWPDTVAVVAGFALVQTAILPVLARRLGMRLGFPAATARAPLRAALAYGGPLLIAGGFGWICLNGIRVVVERVDGLAMVGLVSVGWNLGQRLIGVVATLVTAAAFPLAVQRVAREGVGAGIAQVGQTAILTLGLLLPAAVGLALVSRPFTQVFVGQEFGAATLVVLPLAALAAAVRNLRMHTVDQVFMIAERPGFLLGVNAVEAVATVALCAIGVTLDGVRGACLGPLVATTGCALYSFVVARTQHGFTIPLQAVLRLAVATAAMSAVLLLDIYPKGAWGLAAQVAAGGAVYLGLVALTLHKVLRAGIPLSRPARSSAP
ncbi:lipopolysaccharide biosynthesis protein [Methylobacterium brachythecii]|nr:oligosaccharide flippase family protein [Methylobacterium brachythecii]GLS44520.1 polysaccharide biosynthesis protein [Methylobacterium brachythecii]